MSACRPASFPKRARLRKRREYLHVQRDGRRYHTEHFVVLTAASSWPNARLGITVSSKVGNAVVRNRVKRIVREVVRNLWRDIEAPGDVVIIAKLDAAKTTHVHAATQLRRALGIRNP